MLQTPLSKMVPAEEDPPLTYVEFQSRIDQIDAEIKRCGGGGSSEALFNTRAELVRYWQSPPET